MGRMVIWRGVDEWRTEVARVALDGDSVSATGTQIGVDPVGYRLDYALEVAAGFVTRRLALACEGEGWRRRLALERDGSGAWTCATAAEGEVALPAPGGDTAALADALDCDLGLSPLTNLMPVRRGALHERDGALDLLAAWVSVPDLGLHAPRQRYEHVRPGLVRFVDLGLHDGFTAELELDADGLVTFYPGLARRV
jgi:hypothetical protein